MEKHRLLIIEDDQPIADLVCRVAKEADFDVRIAHDMNNIPTMHNQFMPQLIVPDIVMPEMDGFEVLRFLHSCNSPTRVIILSGRPDYRPMVSHMADALELTVVATVAKPFRVPQLRELLTTIKLSLPVLGDNFSSEAVA